MPPTRLSIIIPTYDTRVMTLACCDQVLSALARSPCEGEVIVVDDASRDGTAACLRRDMPGLRVVRRDINGGYSAAVNTGLACARGDLVLVLNSDACLGADALTAFVRAFRDDPALGVAGARLLDPDGSPQWSGGRLPGLAWMAAVVSGLGPVWSRLRPTRGDDSGDREVEWVCGAAMVLRREVLDALGGFDERVLAYCQDLDICARARRAGWRIRILGRAPVRHAGGATLAAGRRDRLDPARLWPDLLAWGCRHHGPRWAALARPLLVTLGWLRWALVLASGRGGADAGRSIRLAVRRLSAAGRMRRTG